MSFYNNNNNNNNNNNDINFYFNYNRLQGVFDDQSSNKKKTLIFTKLAKNRYDRLKLKEQKIS